MVFQQLSLDNDFATNLNISYIFIRVSLSMFLYYYFFQRWIFVVQYTLEQCQYHPNWISKVKWCFATTIYVFVLKIIKFVSVKEQESSTSLTTYKHSISKWVIENDENIKKKKILDLWQISFFYSWFFFLFVQTAQKNHHHHPRQHSNKLFIFFMVGKTKTCFLYWNNSHCNLMLLLLLFFVSFFS